MEKSILDAEYTLIRCRIDICHGKKYTRCRINFDDVQDRHMPWKKEIAGQFGVSCRVHKKVHAINDAMSYRDHPCCVI